MWSQKVRRGMAWSFEFFGSMPSATALMSSWMKEAVIAISGRTGATHSCASAPVPTVGKEVIRRRAAPIGTSVTVSTASFVRAGEG